MPNMPRRHHRLSIAFMAGISWQQKCHVYFLLLNSIVAKKAASCKYIRNAKAKYAASVRAVAWHLLVKYIIMKNVACL